MWVQVIRRVPSVLCVSCSLLSVGGSARCIKANKFIAKALDTFAGVDDKALSMYLHSKATAWYLRFPPLHSPDRMDSTQKVLEKDHRDSGTHGGRSR